MKIIISIVFLAIYSSFAWGQNSLGIRFTPNVVAQPKVENASDAHIYGEARFSYDAGVDLTHMFTKRFGLQSGIDVGSVDWNYFIEGPIEAFGSRQGSGRFSDNVNINNYFYNGLSLQPVLRFGAEGRKFQISAGPNVRFYYGSRTGDTISHGINRMPPWNPNDPGAGPPDIRLALPPTNLQANFSVSFGFERRISDQANLLIGIRKNWGLSPISDGSLMVNMNDEVYNGKFKTRLNYVGLDLQLQFMTRKVVDMYQRSKPLTSGKNGFRKSVFLEALGNGGLSSINYDMRLARFRNDGFGFRAGFGIGEYFPGGQAEFIVI